MKDTVSPALRGEIERSFGSVADMLRAFDTAREKRGTFLLLATDDAALRLAYGGETQSGTQLYHSDETLDFAILSERYALLLTNRPLYPHP